MSAGNTDDTDDSELSEGWCKPRHFAIFSLHRYGHFIIVIVIVISHYFVIVIVNGQFFHVICYFRYSYS